MKRSINLVRLFSDCNNPVYGREPIDSDIYQLMRIKTCQPKLLPLKSLKWEKLICLIGNAREALARLDEELLREKQSQNILESLKWMEAMSSIRSQNIRASMQEVLRYRSVAIASRERAAQLDKIIFAKKALDAGISWGHKKMGPSFFCHIHAIIKQNGINPQEIGHFRKRQNWIGEEGCGIEDAYFYPPAVSQIRPLMQNVSRYIARRDQEPLVQMAVAFAQLLIIHPFMDGNGRVARVFVPVFAFQKGLLSQPSLFLSAYFEKYRLEYFQKLFLISEKNGWEDWIAYFLTGVIVEAKHTRQTFCRLKKQKASSPYARPPVL